MKRTILVAACFFGLTSVALGAFGAHGLEKIVAVDAVQTFETGVRYQMYHAFFLFALGLVPNLTKKSRKIIFICTLVGIVLFSFSIYLLALNSVTSFDFRVLGILTPIGGLFLIIAWTLLAYKIFKAKS